MAFYPWWTVLIFHPLGWLIMLGAALWAVWLFASIGCIVVAIKRAARTSGEAAK